MTLFVLKKGVSIYDTNFVKSPTDFNYFPRQNDIGKMDVHVGKEIKCVFDKRVKKKLMSVKLMCAHLSVSKETLYRIFNNKNIDIARLWKISETLDFDFFRALSNKYFTHKQNDDNLFLKKEVKRLEADLEYLQKENRLLWDVNDNINKLASK